MPFLIFFFADPDLVSGDGIYSRYLTSYSSRGRYKFFVSADDNENTAYTIQVGRQGRAMPMKPPTPGMPVCCGSQVKVSFYLIFLVVFSC